MKEREMKELDRQDTIEICISKLDFVRRFFWKPIRDLEFSEATTHGLCCILEGIMDDLEKTIDKEEPEKEAANLHFEM